MIGNSATANSTKWHWQYCLYSFCVYENLLLMVLPIMPVRAGSVAVAGHALDCAECAGMRRMRWNAPNALECAGLRRLRRIAPIAPNCADCADCAELRRLRAVCAELRWNCAGILPTAWHTAIYPWLAQPGCDLLTCSLQFPGSACRARVFVAHYSTSSRSPAIFLQLSVMQRDKQCRSKTK